MVKTCKQIEEQIREVKRKLQQSRLANLYQKSLIDESVKNEIPLESTEEIRNTSRN